MSGIDIGSEIEGLVSSLQRSNPGLSASARVKRAWNVTVDNRIAEHVTAVFVVPDTDASEVIVYVDSSIWATELNMQSELLRLNLNIELNKDENFSQYAARKAEPVEKLVFRVSKDTYISKKRSKTTIEQLEEDRKRSNEVETIELTTDELSGIEEALAKIDDDQLRSCAYAAAKANLEWRKGLAAHPRPA